MMSIKDEYREVLENWNDHTLPYDEQLEKGVDQLLAINKRRAPKKIKMSIKNPKTKKIVAKEKIEGYNKAISEVMRELT